MNTEQRKERIQNLEKMMKMEADEKARMILEEVKIKATKDKNRLFGYELDQLQVEYDEKLVQDTNNKKLESSRRNNEIKLEVQKYRNELLEKLRTDLENKIRETIKDKNKYRPFLKNLIMEGLIRLLEPTIKIRAMKADIQLINELIPEIKSEYIKFMKDNAEKDVTLDITIFEKAFLNEEIIGGVVIYCQNNKIVFNNTIKARVDLTFQSSTPDIRKIMFTSLYYKK